jgi:hypothetical protein
MTDLTAVIHELIGLFDRFQLPYAIMGGIAVRAHGLPRPTFDVDFVLAVSRERLGDLFAAIEEAGYTVPDHYRGGWIDSVSGMPLFKVRLFLEGRGIDADIFLVENDFQRDVMSRRILDEIEGKPVQLITAEDLILFKLLAGRPRDILDIKDIVFMQGQLDEGYMRRWAAPLGVSEQLEQALAEREE